MKSRRGFTLLELVMALALVALVLVAMNTFLFSMGELWGRQNEPRLFDLHVRAVTRFLQRELRTAVTPQAEAQAGAGFEVKELRLQDGRNDPVLTFTLPAGSRLLQWPEDRALPDVEAGLVVRERVGLVLLWHSRLEERFADQPPRETVISPWVSDMAFDYYDEGFKNWKTERQLRRETRGSNPVPGRVRLSFAYAGIKQEVVILLPSTLGGLVQP